MFSPHPYPASLKAPLKSSPLYTDMRLTELAEVRRGQPPWAVEGYARSVGDKGKLAALDLQVSIRGEGRGERGAEGEGEGVPRPPGAGRDHRGPDLPVPGASSSLAPPPGTLSREVNKPAPALLFVRKHVAAVFLFF